MSVVAVAPEPARAAGAARAPLNGSRRLRATTSPVGPARPRLLLPPATEPVAAPPHGQVAMRPEVRSLLAPVTAAAWAIPGRFGTAEPAAAPLPDPDRLCGAVVVAAIEALRSSRPLAQLARWVSPAVYEALSRAARPAPVGRPRAVVVRGVRLCRISPTVAEGSAVVHDGERVRAAAVRLEVHRGSWRATVLQIG